MIYDDLPPKSDDPIRLSNDWPSARAARDVDHNPHPSAFVDDFVPLGLPFPDPLGFSRIQDQRDHPKKDGVREREREREIIGGSTRKREKEKEREEISAAPRVTITKRGSGDVFLLGGSDRIGSSEVDT